MSVEELEIKWVQPTAGNFSRWFEKFLVDTKDASDVPDEQELARRRQLMHEIDELRAQIRQKHGVHPDSTPMIRELRDNE